MKNLAFVLILCLCTIVVSGQQAKVFESKIKTNKKPWTNLNFYNDPMNFQFALVSDNTGGMRPGVFESAVGKLNLLMPEFVVSVGDLINGYTENVNKIDSEWKEFNRIINQLKVPFFYLPGNHDITNLVMQKEWENRFGRRYYHYIYKDVLFINIDTNDDDDTNISKEQTEYLIKAIEDNPSVRWTFVLMHHPIWTYNTGGRFQRVEKALEGRKYSVYAGHTHHYYYEERNKNNYYVLGTTGGGSALRGERFGEYDHITWVTMTDDGPVMSNLKLNGILEHDISNNETRVMAKALADNTNFNNVILTNSGDKFTDGTMYIHFTNTSEKTLTFDLAFFHHHQVDIRNPQGIFSLPPGKEHIIEIDLSANKATSYNNLGYLKFSWKMDYGEDENYKDFKLEGTRTIPLKPSSPNVLRPNILQYLEGSDISVAHPFNNLNTSIKVGTDDFTNYSQPLRINKSTETSVILSNNKNQATSIVSKQYSKVKFNKDSKIRSTKTGLNYKYYKGDWDWIPDFTNMVPSKTGNSVNFDMSNQAPPNEDNFAMVYDGYIQVPEDKLYQFRCQANDAANLIIDGQLVCQDGSGAVSNPKQADSFGAIALKKGMHNVKIEFLKKTKGQRLRFYYRTIESKKWQYMDFEDFFRVAQ